MFSLLDCKYNKNSNKKQRKSDVFTKKHHFFLNYVANKR